jgi:hypothetical protein
MNIYCDNVKEMVDICYYLSEKGVKFESCKDGNNGWIISLKSEKRVINGVVIPTATYNEAVSLLKQGNKIPVVKLIRDVTGQSLLCSKEIAEEIASIEKISLNQR